MDDAPSSDRPATRLNTCTNDCRDLVHRALESAGYTLPDATSEGCPPGRLSLQQAGSLARIAARTRLFERLRDAEMNAVALEHCDLRHPDTDPMLVRRARVGQVLPGPKVGLNAGVERRFSLPRFLLRWDRRRLDSIREETLHRLADRTDERGDSDRARYWRNQARLLKMARGVTDWERNTLRASRSAERAARLARSIERLLTVVSEMRAAGLKEEADVLVSRWQGFGTESASPRPYSKVVEDVEDIGSKPTARRREKTAWKWLRDHHPRLVDEVEDLLTAS